MGVRTFVSFGACWTCSCGHTFEDDDVAHALGCNRLSGLVQSRHDETAEVLREFVGRLGFSSCREGRYSWLAPAPPTNPRHAGTFTATCARGLTTFSPTSRSSITWLLSTFVPQPAPPGHAAALRDADKRREYFVDHSCPGYAFRAISFETLG
jgi:hypothetical protein